MNTDLNLIFTVDYVRNLVSFIFLVFYQIIDYLGIPEIKKKEKQKLISDSKQRTRSSIGQSGNSTIHPQYQHKQNPFSLQKLR